MQYHANAAVAAEGDGVDAVGGGDGVGVDKKFPQPEFVSEMEAKHSPQELPEEPQRWHELESPPATT
jgi:hypothetical protein